MVDPNVEAGQESTTPYGYVFDDPMKFTDPDGRAPDITIEGENNSSVTVKTDLIDVKVNVAVDFHGNHTIDGEAAVQTGLDIVSIFDPTGVTSLLSAGLSAKNGDLLGATMGVLGAIPIAGEFAKAEKVANDVKVVDKLIADGEKVATKVENAYSRPNNATTKEQRASVQDKPCVTCGKTESKMVADHKTPLVKEHYETGKIDKAKMRDKNSVQPQCPKCSAKQGAEMSKYSKEQKKINGL